MRFVIHKVHDKSDPGDSSEFEAMRDSLLAWLEAPPRPPRTREIDRGDLIRLLALLGS